MLSKALSYTQSENCHLYDSEEERKRMLVWLNEELRPFPGALGGHSFI